jgi:hypothetical protein
MFPIHETNRRLLCRVIFLVLVPAPTLALATWCATRHVPGYTAAYEERLTAALGVRVRLDSVSHPLPGKTMLHGVELFDPEQGELIATCDELTVTQADDTLLITAGQATVTRKQFDCLWEALHTKLRRPDVLPAKTRLVVRQLRVDLPAKTRLVVRQLRVDVSAGYETLERVDLTIQSGRSGVQSSLAFGLFGAANEQPVRLDIVRNRQSTPPSTQIELRTGATALPCSLLSLTDEGLSALGPKSRFQGVVRMRQTPDGWRIQITGRCSAVDLDRLVTKRFPPHVLSGTADLWIKSDDEGQPGAELINGRLVRAEAVIYASEGRVGGSLIRAVEQHLDIAPVYDKQFPTQPVRFQRLAAALKLDADGLSIRGQKTPDGAIAVIVSGHGPLLGAPNGVNPQPLTNLLHALLPKDDSAAAAAYLEAVLPRPALLR